MIEFDESYGRCYDASAMNTQYQQRFFSFFFFTPTPRAVFVQEVVSG